MMLNFSAQTTTKTSMCRPSMDVASSSHSKSLRTCHQHSQIHISHVLNTTPRRRTSSQSSQLGKHYALARDHRIPFNGTLAVTSARRGSTQSARIPRQMLSTSFVKDVKQIDLPLFLKVSLKMKTSTLVY